MGRTQNRMGQAGRLDEIRRRLAKTGEVDITALARAFGVSEMTIRRDMSVLESQGEIVRTHGGAASARRLTFEFSFRAQQQEHIDRKQAIARAAVKHIADGQVVILDTGTTTLEIARQLRGLRKVNVITTSLAIVSELQFDRDIETILLGGSLRDGSPDLHGPLTEKNLAEFSADIAFIGADAVSRTGAVFTDDLKMVNLDRQMAAVASRAIVVTDSSKLGRRAMCKILEPCDYDLLITDSMIDSTMTRTLKRSGVSIDVSKI